MKFKICPEYIRWCNLFHRRTRSAYVYNGCSAWYNVVLTPRIHSTVKYSQLGQSANICDVSKQPTHTLYMWNNRSDNKQGI